MLKSILGWPSKKQGIAHLRSIGKFRRISWSNSFGLDETEEYDMSSARRCYSHIKVFTRISTSLVQLSELSSR